jgi:hypothetical protein
MSFPPEKKGFSGLTTSRPGRADRCPEGFFVLRKAFSPEPEETVSSLFRRFSVI